MICFRNFCLKKNFKKEIIQLLQIKILLKLPKKIYRLKSNLYLKRIDEEIISEITINI